VHAVRGVDFALVPGEVHALVGENGAGKSTLMHIAYGMIGPDAGSVVVDGRLVSLGSPETRGRSASGWCISISRRSRG